MRTGAVAASSESSVSAAWIRAVFTWGLARACERLSRRMPACSAASVMEALGLVASVLMALRSLAEMGRLCCRWSVPGGELSGDMRAGTAAAPVAVSTSCVVGFLVVGAKGLFLKKPGWRYLGGCLEAAVKRNL